MQFMFNCLSKILLIFNIKEFLSFVYVLMYYWCTVSMWNKMMNTATLFGLEWINSGFFSGTKVYVVLDHKKKFLNIHILYLLNSKQQCDLVVVLMHLYSWI